MSKVLIKPGAVKHVVLVYLAADGAGKSERMLTAALKAAKRSVGFGNVRVAQLLPLAEAGYCEEVDGLWSLTADGHHLLSELNDAEARSRDKTGLVPAREVDKMSGLYDGRELGRNPGIGDERFEAFSLPSVFMGYRTWPDGRSEKI